MGVMIVLVWSPCSNLHFSHTSPTMCMCYTSYPNGTGPSTHWRSTYYLSPPTSSYWAACHNYQTAHGGQRSDGEHYMDHSGPTTNAITLSVSTDLVVAHRQTSTRSIGTISGATTEAITRTMK